MIVELNIGNFKSHKNSIINFYPSLNIFLGEVGAGKTSILEAISFTLFGRCAGNVLKSDLIRRGAKRSKLSLIFSSKKRIRTKSVSVS